MNRFILGLRWPFLVGTLVFLWRVVFIATSARNLAGLALSGLIWYWLTRSKALALDARQPR